MHTIDKEVIHRHIEEMKTEIEQYRLEKRSVEKKKKERRKVPFWTLFFSFMN
ncbi:hypothetical protein [Sporosarcina sp. OR05]|uniref:hypothetical protein n=1 Tax=Sporosarcina sp. OR05 TaxID=2969819 RepID=UPI00352AB0E5